jgi:hypothetical protein
MMEPPKTIFEAIPALGGHEVNLCFCHGKLWCHIDNEMLAKPQEMEELAQGVYSLPELIELFRKRRAEEEGQL